MAEKDVRIQKYLSQAGVCSRRAAEDLILQGKIKVNGRPASIGQKIEPFRDKITISGKPIKTDKNRRYIMLYKPRGFVTTLSDEQGRKCIADLLSDVPERVYPVGRLDRNSEGLLLLTNDGEFANMCTHPKNHVPKTYRVTVRPPFTDEMLGAFIEGVKLDDGYVTAPAEVSVASSEEDRVVLMLTINEGKNRQIRRMCEALGVEVLRLKRISVGEIRLGMLPAGKWRELKEREVRSLYSESKRL